jgi:hypothetical protein
MFGGAGQPVDQRQAIKIRTRVHLSFFMLTRVPPEPMGAPAIPFDGHGRV